MKPCQASVVPATATATATATAGCCQCSCKTGSPEPQPQPQSQPQPEQAEEELTTTEDIQDETNQKDPWTYSHKRLQNLEFPLGGFGTGQILLQGDGSLQGWTIVNNFHSDEYSKGGPYKLPGNLFGISCSTTMLGKGEGGEGGPQAHKTQSYVLQTQTSPASTNTMLPTIPSLTAKCQYPMATLHYNMPDEFPIQVQMECMTPLLPGNTKDSSLPLAIFTFCVHNTSLIDTAQVSLLQSTLNLVGWDGQSVNNENVNDQTNTTRNTDFWQSNVNTPLYQHQNDDGSSAGSSCTYAGWNMTNQNPSLEASRQGSLALVAVISNDDDDDDDDNNDNNNSWTPGILVADHNSENSLWQDFCQGNILDPKTHTTPTQPSPKGHTYIGGVTQTITLPARATKKCQFLLTWFFPNRPCYESRPNLPSPILGNFYQNWYQSAQDVLQDIVPRIPHLLKTTTQYVATLYATTIPWEFLESAAGRVSVLRSPSMFWTQQGVVLGNEGNSCCPLNCSHVYGYSMLLERLYPEWAKNMLYSSFTTNFDPTNGCSMRFGAGGFAIDGSLASVIKVYLVVKQADSNLEFLKQVWKNVKRQMEIVLEQFVQDDEHCVIRGLQQNTYDTAMQGANTFIGTYWITALRVTAILAQKMGEHDFAKQCRKNSEQAAKAYEQICWNEEFQYYVADVDETTCKNSYGSGCFIDQLCATGLSLAAGLGPVLNPAHEKAARCSIFQHNQVAKPPFKDFQNHFYNGDKGVRVCTFPHGKLPGCYVYDDLVSTGFSYPVIAAMIHDGNIDMALQWAKQIRNRHSGVNRSPWNEPECGLLYVRAMCSWNLFDQACGFNYDCTTGALSYAPKFNADDFSCFLTVESGWGQFRQQWDEKEKAWRIQVKCLNGTIRLKSLSTSQVATSMSISNASVVSATLGDTVLSATLCPAQKAIKFAAPDVSIPAGATLLINLTTAPTTTSKFYLAAFGNSPLKRSPGPRSLEACIIAIGILLLSVCWMWLFR